MEYRQIGTPEEAEEARQEILTDLLLDLTDAKEQYAPGSFGCHELLDRSRLLADQVTEQLVQHRACALNQEWFLLATQAADLLDLLYNQIAAVHLEA